MKGAFSIWAFFGITLWIDIITLIVYKITGKKQKRINPYESIKEVSVIIPVYKEEDYIEKTIQYVCQERYPIKNVIVCGGPYSDKTEEIVQGLFSKYPNLVYLKCPDISKAKKINYCVKKMENILGELVYCRDARVIGEVDCIEKMVSYFADENVAVVTSYGRLSAPKNILSRAYYYGKSWINEIGRFRKNAQAKRKAVFVVCGASTMYRTSIVRELPIPYRSKTEDTYYTWKLQIRGFVIKVADDAMVSAPDIDGRAFSGIKSQLKQSYRWSSGTIQCMYSEGRGILKNKKLFYTTIMPGFIESVMYTIPLILLPLLLFLSPRFALGFIIGDTFFSLLGTLIIMPKKFVKTFIHYPEIVFFKYLNGLVFICAVFSVTLQAIIGKTEKWSNEWMPPKTEI